jgi:hypothetical protein
MKKERSMAGLYEQVQAHLSTEAASSQPQALLMGLRDALAQAATGQDTQSLFRRFAERLEAEAPPVLSPSHFMGLPAPERSILLLMLRDTQASLQGLTQAEIVARLSKPLESVDESLAALVEKGWLFIFGEAPNQSYRLNLLRKRESSLGFGIWSILGQRLLPRKDP